MPLHQFKSRKKRLENALTALALGIVMIGMLAFASYDGERYHWDNLLPYLFAIPAALVALIFYVRGSDAK